MTPALKGVLAPFSIGASTICRWCFARTVEIKPRRPRCFLFAIKHILCYNHVMIDCHTHTLYSPDGCETPEAVVCAAVSKGLTYLAITDHLDLTRDGTPSILPKKLAEYRKVLEELKDKYSKEIEIAAGIEVGYTRPNANKISDMITPLNFDFIINSVHEVNGTDCFYAAYFARKSKEKTYGAYFEAVLESLNAPYPYHAVGHLGYVERKAPYPDPLAHHSAFQTVLDAILEMTVEQKKILEINTNMYGAKIPWLPNDGIMNRYKALGGTRVTFSSDAHKTDRVGERYAEVTAFVKNVLQLKGYTVFSNGKERLLPF